MRILGLRRIIFYFNKLVTLTYSRQKHLLVRYTRKNVIYERLVYGRNGSCHRRLYFLQDVPPVLVEEQIRRVTQFSVAVEEISEVYGHSANDDCEKSKNVCCKKSSNILGRLEIEL